MSTEIEKAGPKEYARLLDMPPEKLATNVVGTLISAKGRLNEYAAIPALKREESVSPAGAAVGREGTVEAVAALLMNEFDMRAGLGASKCRNAARDVLALLAQAGAKQEESENV